MKRLLSITLIVVILFTPSISLACKDPLLGETFPITNFDKYDCVVIVKIDHSVHSDELMYNPLVSFKATVVESIKGEIPKNQTFLGKAKKEEANAVCPVHLEKDGIYLFLLSKEKGEYQLSRFSLPVKNDHKYFNNYVAQVKESIKKN